ncbi:hypothetical protein RFI_01658 [Reticulomyxa filosa]|uniref:Uncharacterized protein n=1 Tax=Reticulomyxa filosa TaxID=46433 RepID=X6PA58_RETFI|nr:hypothetical protein RFI_01658 [Reticulomyxa filosa]|eukprot:ETO35405.1 hypothetical protein RFI_01658 [Reticulomyxa filosa]
MSNCKNVLLNLITSAMDNKTMKECTEALKRAYGENTASSSVWNAAQAMFEKKEKIEHKPKLELTRKKFKKSDPNIYCHCLSNIDSNFFEKTSQTGLQNKKKAIFVVNIVTHYCDSLKKKIEISQRSMYRLPVLWKEQNEKISIYMYINILHVATKICRYAYLNNYIMMNV